MQFRTTITIPHIEPKLNYRRAILSLGSCFAERIAERLQRSKFDAQSAPTGILFNPESIAAALDRFDAVTRGDRGAIPSAEELAFGQGRWFCYDFHSEFSAEDAKVALNRMQEAVKRGAEAFQRAEVVIITFGSAFIYRLKQSGEVVANCHKQPHEEFTRERLTVEQVASRYISLLQGPLAHKQVIFTLSPVRHLADGLTETSLSKATLRLAIDAITQACHNAHYFPSYEIVMDELRDYRFYKDDMLHPSDVAVEYIWQRFSEVAIDAKSLKTMERIEQIVRAAEHRPFSPNNEQHLRFCLTMLSKAEQIEREEGVNLREEKAKFKTHL